MFHKIGVLKSLPNVTENPCAGVSVFNNIVGLQETWWKQKLFEKEILAQIFSCEFCKTFKKTW